MREYRAYYNLKVWKLDKYKNFSDKYIQNREEKRNCDGI